MSDQLKETQETLEKPQLMGGSVGGETPSITRTMSLTHEMQPPETLGIDIAQRPTLKMHASVEINSGNGSGNTLRAIIASEIAENGSTEYKLLGVDPDQQIPLLNGQEVSFSADEPLKLGVADSSHMPWTGRRLEDPGWQDVQASLSVVDGAVVVTGNETSLTGVVGYDYTPTAVSAETLDEAVVEDSNETDIEVTIEQAESNVSEQEPEVDSAKEQPLGPTLREAFESPEAFLATMTSPETDAELKAELSAISRAWQELQVAKLTDEVWGEMIVPRLKEFADLAPKIMRTGRSAEQQLEQLNRGLGLLSTAVEYRDINEIGQLASRFRFYPALQEAARDIVATLDDEHLGQADRLLSGEELEADERIRKVAQPLSYGSPTEAQASDVVEGLGELAQAGATPEQIKGAIDELFTQTGGKAWRVRQAEIKEVLDFSRQASNVTKRNVVRGRIQHLSDDLEFQLRRGVNGMNSADLKMIQVKIERELLQPCQQMVRIAAIVGNHAEELK